MLAIILADSGKNIYLLTLESNTTNEIEPDWTFVSLCWHPPYSELAHIEMNKKAVCSCMVTLSKTISMWLVFKEYWKVDIKANILTEKTNKITLYICVVC